MHDNIEKGVVDIDGDCDNTSGCDWPTPIESMVPSITIMVGLRLMYAFTANDMQ